MTVRQGVSANVLTACVKKRRIPLVLIPLAHAGASQCVQQYTLNISIQYSRRVYGDPPLSIQNQSHSSTSIHVMHPKKTTPCVSEKRLVPRSFRCSRHLKPSPPIWFFLCEVLIQYADWTVYPHEEGGWSAALPSRWPPHANGHSGIRVQLTASVV